MNFLFFDIAGYIKMITWGGYSEKGQKMDILYRRNWEELQIERSVPPQFNYTKRDSHKK